MTLSYKEPGGISNMGLYSALVFEYGLSNQPYSSEKSGKERKKAWITRIIE
jgi:hypothetical protein